MPRDNIGETQALIDIVMNINGYTINDMIPNMNELIRNQLTARDKVNFEERKEKQTFVWISFYSYQYFII
jgi:hypothetical protein